MRKPRFGAGSRLRVERRYCRTLTVRNTRGESIRLDMCPDESDTHPLPHGELVGLQCGAEEARLSANLARQTDDLARAA